MRADELWAAPTLAALHRARTRSGSACPPPLDSELHRFLSEADEQEVLGILRERFRHEQRITSDDVRLVVRAVASRGGSVDIPPDFPPPFWILEFKRVHGFSQLGGTFTLGLPDSLDVGRSSSSRGRIARVTASSVSSGGSSDDERDHGSHYVAAHESSACARSSKRPAFVTGSPLQHTRRQQQHQQHQRRSMVVNDHRAASQSDQTSDREEIGSSTTSDSENGATTGASSCSSGNASVELAPPSTKSNNSNRNESSQDSVPTSSEKRGYKLSHTVPAETWEKAIAAVEQQGMSLRASAKIYGVHFAALHRRVKKRTQGGQSSQGNNSYFHPSDEAGIMRVVVAHAELGVLMTFHELMKLVEAAALRKLPDISVENARKLLVRFQSRNEQSIRHIIEDWPPPVPAVSSGASTASHYHLEHPGYDYGSRTASAAMQPARVTDGTATVAAVAAAPSQFLPPSRLDLAHSFPINGDSRPVLPSMTAHKSPLPPCGSTMTSQLLPPAQLPQRVPRDHRSRPVMFV
ncbi:hypothetical protein PC129_g20670 [Phytophthora cactorum]|uniref:HTH psq-type domain-containing protein n=1 Tax=Phytophthora cactorum TaxID=29920 RepID=A0A329SRL9_9STRA|nr:hypothetical protein Pcac1_g2112 [Phytophthora cactorum]KAG2798452.1 hypothetical protein PC112_g21343 [Phytophthora cactorum]KAG2798549.1 hypothetical protein PC111_g20807 [Phytophthora cactorum]KAG2833292.1 hypothetical protein PC113_g20597 [Phytophthora cactorum]KAG2878878.1 hypothetical protein PC114_g22855 [Phytophthora cactorum]